MKKTIERLMTGFISSIMVMSFILMPIPVVNTAFAEDAKKKDCPDNWRPGDIYQPGCEWHEAMSTTDFNSSAQYQDGKKVWGFIPKGFVEQYIVGLTSVVLINSLNYQRLYKYDPINFGNDCPGSFGHWSIPVGMLAGTSYLVGDLQSNWKFKKSAKEAVDLAFENKAKEKLPTDEGQVVEDVSKTNDQMAAFDSLRRIMQRQQKALKVKKTTNRLTSIGYKLADGVELANIGYMTGMCIKDYAAKSADLAKAASEATIATTAVSSAIASSLGTMATVCTDVAAGIGVKSGVASAKKAKNIAISANKARRILKYSKRATQMFTTFLDSVVKIPFDPAKESQVVADSGKAAKEAIEEEIDDKATAATENSSGVGVETADSAKNSAMNILAAKCVAAGEVVKNFYATIDLDSKTAVACCGGNGASRSLIGAVEGLKASEINPYAVVKDKVKEQVKQTILQKVKSAALKTIGLPKAIIEKLKKKEDSGLDVAKGTFLWQGVPAPPGLASFKKDIKVESLFALTASYQSDEKAKQRYKNLRYFLENSFEVNLRQMVASNFVIDKSDYVASLNEFARQTESVNDVVKEYKNFLDKEFHYILRDKTINTKTLAFQKFMNVFVSKLLIPKAQAGLTGTLIGAGLAVGSSKIKGPWSSVLGLSGKMVLMHNLLGKFIKNTALTRPATRALMWTALAVFADLAKNMNDDAYDKVKQNIAILDEEQKRFKESAFNSRAYANNGGEGLNTIPYVPNPPTGPSIFDGANVCATPSFGGGNTSVNPANCTSGAGDPNKFLTSDLSGLKTIGAGFSHANALADISQITSRIATRGIADQDFSDSTLTGLDNTNNAIRKLNDNLRKDIDKKYEDAPGYEDFAGDGFQSRVAKIRKQILDNHKNALGSRKAADLIASPSQTQGKAKKNSKVAAYKAPKVNIPKTNTGIDFGDLGEDEIADLDLDTSAKEAVSMDEFVVNHDDISKKKDVSIFKILSNRYILRYPKMLEEKDKK